MAIRALGMGCLLRLGWLAGPGLGVRAAEAAADGAGSGSGRSSQSSSADSGCKVLADAPNALPRLRDQCTPPRVAQAAVQKPGPGTGRCGGGRRWHDLRGKKGSGLDMGRWPQVFTLHPSLALIAQAEKTSN